MTRDKKGTSKKRVILDLSFPENLSVNSGVDKSKFVRQNFKLHLPSSDSVRDVLINKLGVYVEYRFPP